MTGGHRRVKIHIVKKGDTLYFIGKKYNVSIEEILSLNPGITNPDVLEVGMKLKIPSAQGQNGIGGVEVMHQHVVKQGDTLWKLSKAWGVPLAAMVYANPHLKNPNVLLTGEIVNIPKADTVVPPTAMPGKTNTAVKQTGGVHPLHPTSIMQGVQGMVGKLSTAPVIGKKNTAPVQEKAPTAPISPVPAPAPKQKEKEAKVEPLEKGKVEPLATKVEPLEKGKVEPLATKVEPLETGKVEPLATKVEPLETGKVEPLATKVEPMAMGKVEPLATKVEPMAMGKVEPLATKVEPLSGHKVEPLSSNVAPLSTGKTLPNAVAPLSTGKTLPNESIMPLSTGKTLPNAVAPLSTGKTLPNAYVAPMAANNYAPLSTNVSPMSMNNVAPLSTNVSPLNTNNVAPLSTNVSPMSMNNYAPLSTNVSPMSMNNYAPMTNVAQKALPIQKMAEQKVTPAQSEYMQYMDMDLFQQYNMPATEAMYMGNQPNVAPVLPNAGMMPYGEMPYGEKPSMYPYDCPPGAGMMGYPAPSMMPYGGAGGWGYPGGGYAGVSENNMMMPLSNMPNHAGMVSPLSGMPTKGLPQTMSTMSAPVYGGAGYPMTYPPYAPSPLWQQNANVSSGPTVQSTANDDCGCGGKREDELELQQEKKSSLSKSATSKPRKKAKKAVIRTVAPRPKKRTSSGSRPWLNR
ncbi:hypothetical protein B1748_03640 [Paenibacillus sp. MY03]|nr:hypothetical protein B1748_03640 [Paenibacillus sp. MY03]